jgi:hypothetical protein
VVATAVLVELLEAMVVQAVAVAVMAGMAVLQLQDKVTLVVMDG